MLDDGLLRAAEPAVAENSLQYLERAQARVLV